MLEYKMDTESGQVSKFIQHAWVPYKATDLSPTFIGYKLRINGIVYSEINAEFLEAFDKETLWEKLQK